MSSSSTYCSSYIRHHSSFIHLFSVCELKMNVIHTNIFRESCAMTNFRNMGTPMSSRRMRVRYEYIMYRW